MGPLGDYSLYCIVRDFRKSHPDFDVAGRTALVVDNVATVLDSNLRPSYTGHGYELNRQFHDGDTPQRLSPQLYFHAGGVVRLLEPAMIGMGTTVDTYMPFAVSAAPRPVSSVVAPLYEVGADMPSIVVPGPAPPIAGPMHLAVDTVLSGDQYCTSFTVTSDATLTIDGHVAIVCEESFVADKGSTIELLDGATLKIYIKSEGLRRFVVADDAQLNTTSADHTRVIVYAMGDATVRVRDDASMYATVVTPDGRLSLSDTAQFHGAYTGRALSVQDSAGFHHANGRLCAAAANDIAGEPGSPNTGSVTSARTFAEWYRDVLSVNVSGAHEMMFEKQGPVWRFEPGQFLPIDDALFGNEGDPHNLNFTTELHAGMNYIACSGQFISVRSSDEAWLFVNGKLVLDLGGLGVKAQRIEFDRLGLEPGQHCSIRLFTAHRSQRMPDLRIVTNVPLARAATPIVTVSAD